MNFKSLLPTVCLVAPALAAPALRLHDGTGWQELDAAALAKLPRTELVAKARDGKDKRYSGIALAELLKLAGAPSGESLRGPEMNRVVLLTAADNYQVAFSLVELDPSFREQKILLADQADGKPLDDHEGPLMVVSAGDLRHSRWIRQVKEFALTRPIAPAPERK